MTMENRESRAMVLVDRLETPAAVATISGTVMSRVSLGPNSTQPV